MIQPLGIDNVLFGVANLDAAISFCESCSFYESCGFRLKTRFDHKGVAVLAVGAERSGLVLREGAGGGGGRLWVELEDAKVVATILEGRGLEVVRVETGTGLTCEVSDPSGNRLGFADYSRAPKLRRTT